MTPVNLAQIKMIKYNNITSRNSFIKKCIPQIHRQTCAVQILSQLKIYYVTTKTGTNDNFLFTKAA